MLATSRMAMRAAARTATTAHGRGISTFGKSDAFDAVFGGEASVDAVMLQVSRDTTVPALEFSALDSTGSS